MLFIRLSRQMKRKYILHFFSHVSEKKDFFQRKYCALDILIVDRTVIIHIDHVKKIIISRLAQVRL